MNAISILREGFYEEFAQAIDTLGSYKPSNDDIALLMMLTGLPEAHYVTAGREVGFGPYCLAHRCIDVLTRIKKNNELMRAALCPPVKASAFVRRSRLMQSWASACEKAQGQSPFYPHFASFKDGSINSSVGSIGWNNDVSDRMQFTPLGAEFSDSDLELTDDDEDAIDHDIDTLEDELPQFNRILSIPNPFKDKKTIWNLIGWGLGCSTVAHDYYVRRWSQWCSLLYLLEEILVQDMTTSIVNDDQDNSILYGWVNGLDPRLVIGAIMSCVDDLGSLSFSPVLASEGSPPEEVRKLVTESGLYPRYDYDAAQLRSRLLNMLLQGQSDKVCIAIIHLARAHLSTKFKYATMVGRRLERQHISTLTVIGWTLALPEETTLSCIRAINGQLPFRQLSTLVGQILQTKVTRPPGDDSEKVYTLLDANCYIVHLAMELLIRLSDELTSLDTPSAGDGDKVLSLEELFSRLNKLAAIGCQQRTDILKKTDQDLHRIEELHEDLTDFVDALVTIHSHSTHKRIPTPNGP
uniref:ARAD1A05852p n=1 Tax=Blastobotrys adeninivorans TaxID=409370 RepID=A0A060T321_BLAAD